jgi:phage terminase small subunit
MARAARSAGYSEKTARQIATENLSKPYIQAAITAKQQETAVKLELRKEHVLLAHMEAISLARAQGQPMAMISGAREIGKLMGFYGAEVVELALGKNKASLQARYESMTDAELVAIIGGKCAASFAN